MRVVFKEEHDEDASGKISRKPEGLQPPRRPVVSPRLAAIRSLDPLQRSAIEHQIIMYNNILFIQIKISIQHLNFLLTTSERVILEPVASDYHMIIKLKIIYTRQF